MPITLQRKSLYTNETNEEHNIASSDSFLFKFLIRIPLALLLLCLIFLWSSSTTFMSGTIVHVCVTPRKLNNRLYCLSPGNQTTDIKIPNPNVAHKISYVGYKETKDSIKRNGTKTPSSITMRENTKIKAKREEEIEVAWKDVEEKMEVLRSYKTSKFVNYSNSEACDGRKIYVYDLPPRFNKELLGYCNDMMTWLDFCNFLSNNAFGEAVPQLGDGWYNTHQYALEPIFHARVLKHPCRVHEPEKAKLFYVPYYGGFDILRWHFKENTSLELKDKLSYELMDWLNQQNVGI